MHWIMQLRTTVLLAAAMTTSAAAQSSTWMASSIRQDRLLSRPARLDVQSTTLPAALTELARSARVPVAFSPSMLPAESSISCDCANATVAEALERLLHGTHAVYREIDGQIVVSNVAARGLPGPLAPSSPALASLSTDILVVPPTVDSMGALQGGRVAGLITDSRATPISGVRVVVQGTAQGAFADADGRFRIDNVSGREITLRATIIGYQPATLAARVGDINLRIVMTAIPVSLEEIVVTGTPGGVQRRSLGNAVSTINAAQLLDRIAPAPDLTKLINARAPGVLFQPASGAAGGGGRIRIRGVPSLSLPLEPLIYVDGVRMDNRVGTGPTTGSSPTSAGIWPSMSRLNDINPSEIERVEIIKGPAAATLYGTEAANGVIQIFTKRGSPGRARWNLNVAGGASWISNPEGRFRQIYRRATDGSIYHFNLIETENARGTPIFRTAPTQRYNLDVSGGSESAQYFLAAGYNDEMGVLDPNRQRRFTGDANIQVQINPRLGITTSAHYVTGRTNIVEESVTSGRGTVGSLHNPFRLVDPTTDPARGFNVAPPEAWNDAFDFYQDLTRYTWSLQVRHNPVSWFNQRLTVGRDAVYEDNISMNERLDGQLAQLFAVVRNGRRDVNEIDAVRTSADYSGTATTQIFTPLKAKTSVGAQLYRSDNTARSLSGEDFPATGLQVVGAASRREALENFVRNTTVGLFVEEQLDWKGRLFLTGGLRADDNSSFGAEFNFVTYPKVSAAWVISEEPFWRPLRFVQTLRLRAAYGTSGQQPDAFSALRTYAAISGPGDVSAVRPLAPGNPRLGPERGQEIEAGFEAAMLNDRLSIDFTYYNKLTKDAIVARPAPPSGGFPTSQLVNIGRVRNKGIELQLTGGAIRSSNVNLDLGFNLSTNNNKVLDLGGDTFIAGVGANQAHVVGFPTAAFFERLVLSGDLNNGVFTNLMCDGGGGVDYTAPTGVPVPCATAPRVYLGKPIPNLEGAFNTTLTLFNRLTVYGLLDFKFGATVFDASTYFACLTALQCELNYYPERDPAKAVLYALPGVFGRSVTPVNRNFAKLRQVSLSYTLPEHLLRRFGITSSAVTVSARELYTFKGSYEGTDPELVTQTGTQYYINFHQLPSPMQLTTSVKLTF